MSEIININSISAAYNMFGDALIRIYNNNNDIIWESNNTNIEYLWVEPEQSMLSDGNNYIGFYGVNRDNTDKTLPENTIQYSLDGRNWQWMPSSSGATNNEIEITQKTYFDSKN